MVGINFIGDITGDSGVCEGARLTLQAIQQQAIAVSYIQKAYNIPRQAEMVKQYAQLTRGNRHPINLLYYNQTDTAHEKSELQHLTNDKYTIAYWVWELMTLPHLAIEAFELVDEIWTASHFCKAIYQQYTDKPVSVIPHPIYVPDAVSPNIERFEIPQDRLVFMFNFNVSSVFARKNPLAIISAFRKAFDGLSPAQMPVLVIKTQQLEHYPLVKQVLSNRMKEIGGILIDGSLSRAEMYSLLASCDVYVSLHRSEGFGLGMAEAMYLGKPVIATAYSGNLDYMTDENSCLVDYQLRRILPDDHRYSPKDIHIFPPNGQWADPDINHAAYFMQQLYADPALRQAMGDCAARSIRDYCGFAQVGERITSRLRHLDKSDLQSTVRSRTSSQTVASTNPTIPAAEPSPQQFTIETTHHGVFQSKYMEWQMLRVKGDMRSVENPILRRIPLLGFLYRTWYRIRHLGTLLAVQTQLIDLLSSKHHEQSAHIQTLVEQNRELQSYMTKLAEQDNMLEAQIGETATQIQNLQTDAEQQYKNVGEDLAMEVSRWQFFHDKAMQDVQAYMHLESNALDEKLNRLKNRQQNHKDTLLERLASVEEQLENYEQTHRKQLSDYASQTDDSLRIIVSRQRYFDRQAERVLRQSEFHGLLNIVKTIESLFEEIANAKTVDVSIQGTPHPDDLEQLFDYWGERIQIVAPTVQYHFDFTASWNRSSVFENASNKIMRQGLFILVTDSDHQEIPEITMLELIADEPVALANKPCRVYIFRNLREDDIYGN